MPRFKSKTELATELGISLSTLQRKIKNYNLNVPRGLISPIAQEFIKERLNNDAQTDLFIVKSKINL